jgi:hypothetical protein
MPVVVVAVMVLLVVGLPEMVMVADLNLLTMAVLAQTSYRQLEQRKGAVEVKEATVMVLM